MWHNQVLNVYFIINTVHWFYFAQFNECKILQYHNITQEGGLSVLFQQVGHLTNILGLLLHESLWGCQNFWGINKTTLHFTHSYAFSGIAVSQRCFAQNVKAAHLPLAFIIVPRATFICQICIFKNYLLFLTEREDGWGRERVRETLIFVVSLVVSMCPDQGCNGSIGISGQGSNQLIQGQIYIYSSKS